jgi:hypothetical protein
MKSFRKVFSLLVVLSVLISGLGYAAPVSWALGTLPASMAQVHEDCDDSSIAPGANHQHLSAQTLMHHDGSGSGSGHDKAGCCSSVACPCPSGFAGVFGFAMPAPAPVAVTAIITFRSNRYSSPAAQRRIKPPIA